MLDTFAMDPDRVLQRLVMMAAGPPGDVDPFLFHAQQTRASWAFSA